MAKLKSEIEVHLPVLQRDAGHRHESAGGWSRTTSPNAATSRSCSEATRILADEAARREALFEQSFETKRMRDDALSRRFEEALKQAKQEPITKPMRDFDLD